MGILSAPSCNRRYSVCKLSSRCCCCLSLFPVSACASAMRSTAKRACRRSHVNKRHGLADDESLAAVVGTARP